MSAATDPRWYVRNSMHMATLCAGKEDAEAAAAEYDLQYPLRAPHRAVQLVEVSPPLAVSMSDVDQAQLAAMLAQAPAMPLVAALDESKLAACFDQIKSDLIADGAVEHDLRLEFFPEAVLDAFRRQRAARQEAQQRLADMRELAAKAGLAHRKAEPVAWMWRVADSDWQLESTCPPERPLAIVEPLYTGYMADAYIEAQQRLADAVRQLHGRDLCCCCAPAACHGDVLVAAAAWLSRPAVAECPATPHPIPPSPANP